MSKVFDFTFTLGVDEVQPDGRSYQLEASGTQLADFADRFKLVALNSFSAAISVQRDAKSDIIWVRGDIKADLIQQCVVTLGDAPEQVAESFELMLVSPELAAQMDEDEVYLDPKAPDYDAFDGPILAVGDVVAQTLSVVMDPYPKQVGAELKVPNGQGVAVNEALEEKPNPFAVLSKLGDKS